MSSDSDSDQLQAEYQAGQVAFERGDYRQAIACLERATALVALGTRLGGEVQAWLVTAYEAAGQRTAAIDLCRKLSVHPDYLIRKQGKRLLYILEAPKLQARPEWLTEIPDLGKLSDRNESSRAAGSASTSRRSPPPRAIPEPVDPTQVNTQDNQFVWLALGLAGLILGSLVWFS